MVFPHDGVKFEPGKSGNPSGCPGRPSQAVYRELLEMNVNDLPLGALAELRKKFGAIPVKKAMALQMISKMLEGGKDMVNIHKEIYDRAEGKSVQSVDVTTHNEPDELSPADVARRVAFGLEQAAAEAENPVMPSSSDQAETTVPPSDEPILGQ